MKFELNEHANLFGRKNYILKGGNPETEEFFYLSYNPDPGSGFEMFQGDNGSSETALYTRVDDKFRILNGDFREEYEAAFPSGVDACLEVYNKHKAEKRSSWSEDDEVEPKQEVEAREDLSGGSGDQPVAA